MDMATSTTPDRDISALAPITAFVAKATRHLLQATRDGRIDGGEILGLVGLCRELPGLLKKIHDIPFELLDLTIGEVGELKSIIGAELAEAIADEAIAERHIDLTLRAMDCLVPFIRLVQSARGIPAPAGE